MIIQNCNWLGLMTIHSIVGKVPSESHLKMEFFRFLVVMLSWILSGTRGNQHPAYLKSDHKALIENMSLPI